MENKLILREWLENEKRHCVCVIADVNNENRIVEVSIREYYELEKGGEDFILLPCEPLYYLNNEWSSINNFIYKWRNWCNKNNYKLKIISIEGKRFYSFFP